jgi:hypothetical protein
MNQSNDSFKEKIFKWLDSQGYPLEMEVARVFENNRFGVSISDIYQDFENGDDREIDVIASTFSSFRFNPVLRIYWAIECKLSKDKPWIIFLSDMPTSKDSHLVPVGLIASDEFGGKLINKYFDKNLQWRIDELEFLNPSKTGHSLTQALTSGQDVSYKAMQSCIKASFDSVLKTPEPEVNTSASKKVNKRIFWSIAFPVIVIDGKLFEYSKNQNDKFQLEETGYGVVEWKGNNPLNARPYIYVVTRNALEEFVKRARKLTDLLIEIAQQNS